MLSLKDKNIILNVIQTGEFPKLSELNYSSQDINNIKLISILKGNDFTKKNYALAEKISNQLMIDKNKLKKNLTRLIAIELNQYQDDLIKRDKIYRQINQLSSNLLAFPENKRIIKFLVKFTMTSKALQAVVSQNKNPEILLIFKQINSEVK